MEPLRPISEALKTIKFGRFQYISHFEKSIYFYYDNQTKQEVAIKIKKEDA